MPSLRLDWLAEARAWHAAAYALGQPVDVARAGGPFGDHQVLLVPNLYALTPQQADALAVFVSGGGQLAVGPFSGVVDHREQMFDGGAPGPLRELLGVEVEEWWPLADGRTRSVVIGEHLFPSRVWGEWIDVDARTEIVATYADGDLAGRPAITRRSHGAGSAWYVSAGLETAGMQTLLTQVFAAAGVPTADAPNTALEVLTRTNGSTDFTFVLNHGREPLVVSGIVDGVDLLTHHDFADGLTLDPFGVAVVAHPNKARPAVVTSLPSPIPSARP